VGLIQSQIQEDANVKYTIILPQTSIDILEAMTQSKMISSIDHGILLAIEDFIKAYKKMEYKVMMREAADDTSFIERTMKTQEDFSKVDVEGL